MNGTNSIKSLTRGSLLIVLLISYYSFINFLLDYCKLIVLIYYSVDQVMHLL